MAKLVKMTMEMDKAGIQKLQRLLNAKTDKEAVNKALKLIAEESDIIRTHTALVGILEFERPPMDIDSSIDESARF